MPSGFGTNLVVPGLRELLVLSLWMSISGIQEDFQGNEKGTLCLLLLFKP